MIESRSTSFSAIAVTCYWAGVGDGRGARENLARVGRDEGAR